MCSEFCSVFRFLRYRSFTTTHKALSFILLGEGVIFFFFFLSDWGACCSCWSGSGLLECLSWRWVEVMNNAFFHFFLSLFLVFLWFSSFRCWGRRGKRHCRYVRGGGGGQLQIYSCRGSHVPVPESAIFGCRRVPRHVPQYPWYRMRALDFALATTPFRGKKFRARRSCSGWLLFVVNLKVIEVLVNFSFRDVWTVVWLKVS